MLYEVITSADVTAIIGGNVKEIKVFHGDKVNKGQVLAILEHPDYIVLHRITSYNVCYTKLLRIMMKL